MASVKQETYRSAVTFHSTVLHNPIDMGCSRRGNENPRREKDEVKWNCSLSKWRETVDGGRHTDTKDNTRGKLAACLS